jgi:hypothetical protein
MFDTTNIIKRGTEYIPYEKTVIVKNAPTDESIKIYNEFKEKAYNSIIDNLEIKNSLVEVKGVVYREFSTDSLICAFAYKINGDEIKDKFTIDWNYDDDEQRINEFIFKKISEFLAIKLLISINK